MNRQLPYNSGKCIENVFKSFGFRFCLIIYSIGDPSQEKQPYWASNFSPVKC